MSPHRSYARAQGIIQGVASLILAIFIFDSTLHGNILWILITLLLDVFSFIGSGIVLTSVAEDEQTASMIIMTFTMPMFFLSGILPNTDDAKLYADGGSFTPLHLPIDAIRRIMIFGVTLSAVATDLFVMVGFGIAMLLIAIPAFNKAMTR